MVPLSARLLDASCRGQVTQLHSLLGSSLSSTLRIASLGLSDLLASAARGNQPQAVAYLLSRGAKVNDAVTAAAHAGATFEVYRLLVPAGLDVNRSFGTNGGALTRAIIANDVGWVSYLLLSGARPDATPYGSRRLSALALATERGVDLRILEALVRTGADVRARGLLPLAVVGGHLRVVQWLLAHGANVEERAEQSRVLPSNVRGSVLQLAAERGRLEIVRCLLDHGADVNSRG
jgi:ankyrin repeat protein